jgi:hypothetical protein
MREKRRWPAVGGFEQVNTSPRPTRDLLDPGGGLRVGEVLACDFERPRLMPMAVASDRKLLTKFWLKSVSRPLSSVTRMPSVVASSVARAWPRCGRAPHCLQGFFRAQGLFFGAGEPAGCWSHFAAR